jgi:transcriptional regulator with XRE-family HTH domain
MPSPASVKPGFDRWLAYVRRANGLSQHELSLRLGVGERTIRAWESGESRPCWRSLRQIAQATDTVMADLLELERGELALRPRRRRPR